jgi:hypothetical protein
MASEPVRSAPRLSQTRARRDSNPNLLIRSYFTPPNLRLKTPALTLVVRPLTSAEVRRFPFRLRYFAAVLLRSPVAELPAAAEA